MTPLASRVRLFFRWLAVAVCLLHVLTTRNDMNPDGVSYLEVSQAYLRGDFTPNSYWGPLLSVLLAGAQALLPLGPEWEACVTHGVLFACFLLALVAFEWLLTELTPLASARGLPDWAVVGLAYGAFAWVARWGIKVATVTPDLLVAAATYASAALLLRLRRAPETRWAAPVLGVVLGVGFLAKTVVLAVGAAALGTLVLTLPWQYGWHRALGAGVVLALFVGPYVAVLSLHQGRLTAGESGRLNYYWEVAHGPRPERLAVVEERTTLPIRRHDAPPVVELPLRSGATYALWYDCTPWYEGVARPFDAGRQISAWGKACWAAAYEARRPMAPVTAALGLVVLMSLFLRTGPLGLWWAGLVAGLGSAAPLLLVAGGVTVVYATTGVIEGRLIGPFVVLATAGLVLALPAPVAQSYTPAVGLLGLALLATLGYDASLGATAPVAHPHWAVVQRLRDLGVQPGQGIGTIGSPYTAYWAHLAGTPAVAEVPDGSEKLFWEATPEQQAAALAAMRRAGAIVVVAETEPRAGWEQVPGTRFALRKLE